VSETADSPTTPGDGIALMRQFIPNSPFAARVGIEIDTLEPGRAVLRLPYREENATMGDLVHGGAIGALVDTAAMAAAWSGSDLPEQPRGTTVGMSLSFVAGAQGEDLAAEDRVVRRGQSLCHLDVEVTGEDWRPVAKALVIYKLG
jgi:uncharacterized protein (TIGR00369 family)